VGFLAKLHCRWGFVYYASSQQPFSSAADVWRLTRRSALNELSGTWYRALCCKPVSAVGKARTRVPGKRSAKAGGQLRKRVTDEVQYRKDLVSAAWQAAPMQLRLQDPEALGWSLWLVSPPRQAVRRFDRRRSLAAVTGANRWARPLQELKTQARCLKVALKMSLPPRRGGGAGRDVGAGRGD